MYMILAFSALLSPKIQNNSGETKNFPPAQNCRPGAIHCLCGQSALFTGIHFQDPLIANPRTESLLADFWRPMPKPMGTANVIAHIKCAQPAYNVYTK
jgi:hypothetical protein